MIHATGKYWKKSIFLIFILGSMILFALTIPPVNLVYILIMNILIGTFFFFLLKIFLTKRFVIAIVLPIFLIITLLSLKLLDLLNLILAICLSIAVGLLIK